nr:MAG TPA: hypothetical protein [Crassvirales sp.]
MDEGLNPSSSTKYKTKYVSRGFYICLFIVS